MKNISYSAPAKVILSGEHAVVYGKPAVVTALEYRLRVTVSSRIKQKKTLIEELTEKAVITFFKTRSINYSKKQFSFNIVSNIPIRRGLGSSAALSVASSAGLMEFFGEKEFSKDEINQVAYQIEKYFHKNSSGVDVSTSCFGGLLYYRKEFEFLKCISRLPQLLPKFIEDEVVLIDSGKPQESTAEMVQYVADCYNKNPIRVERIMNEIEKVVKQMVMSIVQQQKDQFVNSIEHNQKLLEALGVVSQDTIKLMNTLKQFGSGKIVGAGGKKTGSGIILFVLEKLAKKKLYKYCKEHNIEYYEFQQSQKGVIRV